METYFCYDCNEIVHGVKDVLAGELLHTELEDGGPDTERWYRKQCPICGGTNVHQAARCEACGKMTDPRREWCEDCRETALRHFRKGIDGILLGIRINTGCSERAAQELLDWAVDKEGI